MIFGRGGENKEPSVPDIHLLLRNSLERLKERAPRYRIRIAEKDDLTSVQKINYVSLPENYPPYFFHDLWERFRESFYVAESPEGEIVGYVMCRVEHKPGFFHRLLVKSGHIVSIAVLEGHRNRGLGYALMTHALVGLHDVYGCRESYLEVRVTNKPAISLYEKLGYKIIKIIHHYYLDGEDAFLMARPLP